MPCRGFRAELLVPPLTVTFSQAFDLRLVQLWMTNAISQSARAENTHLPFDRQFYPTVQNHFLSVNSRLASWCQWSYSFDGQRGICVLCISEFVFCVFENLCSVYFRICVLCISELFCVLCVSECVCCVFQNLCSVCFRISFLCISEFVFYVFQNLCSVCFSICVLSISEFGCCEFQNLCCAFQNLCSVCLRTYMLCISDNLPRQH